MEPKAIPLQKAAENDDIALWRFEKLRAAMVEALVETSALLHHEETGTWFDKVEVYHKLVRINHLLAAGLYEGTQA